MSASEMDSLRQGLKGAWRRGAPLRHGDAVARSSDGGIAELPTALEELRVAEEKILDQCEELREDHGLGEQQLWRYQALFDAAPAAYVITDLDGVITDVNGVAQGLFGLASDRLVGMPMSVLIDVRRRRDFRLAVNRLTLPEGHYELDLRLDTPTRDKTDVVASVSTGVTTAEGPELWWILHPTDADRQRDMLAEAVMQLTALLPDANDTDELLTRFCEQAAGAAGAASCAALLVDPDGDLIVAASDRSTELLELFEVQNGKGPCFDAFRTNNVIPADVLDHHSDVWPEFVCRAREQRVRSVLSIPLRVGSAAIGGFSLLHKRMVTFGDRDVLIAETLGSLAAFGISVSRTLDHLQETVAQLRQERPVP